MVSPSIRPEQLKLKQAIQAGDLSEVKNIFSSIAPFSRTGIGEAFFLSIKQNQFNIFTYFVQEVDGLDLRYTDEKGRRALHHAVDVGSKEIIKVLLSPGAPLNYADNDGYQVIHLATQNGDLDILTLLLTRGANVSSAKTLREGYTPFHIAALNNRPRALELLVGRSGSLNTQTRRQHDLLTPLHIAVKSSFLEIVKILCENGASLDVTDSEGRTPLHFAADKGNIEILNILFEYGASSLVNSVDASGRSVLNYAVFSIFPECVQLIIDKGANVNHGKDNGRSGTPLISAVTVGSLQIVDVLIQNGADVNVMIPNNETPLLLASFSGHVGIVRSLLLAVASVKSVNRQRETALHKCQKVSQDKRDELVRVLVDAGTDLNAVDGYGFTPLHNCAFQIYMDNFSLSTLKILVESGALLQATDSGSESSRHSPLCMLVWNGNLEAARYLVNCGWNLFSETWIYLPGKTPEQDQCHQWMRDVCKDPPSLLWLCRASIRHHFITKCTLGCEVLSSLSKLEIPRTLKEYLMLKDV